MYLLKSKQIVCMCVCVWGGRSSSIFEGETWRPLLLGCFLHDSMLLIPKWLIFPWRVSKFPPTIFRLLLCCMHLHICVKRHRSIFCTWSVKSKLSDFVQISLYIVNCTRRLASWVWHTFATYVTKYNQMIIGLYKADTFIFVYV